MKRIIVVILFFSLVLCSCVRGYTEETSISSFDSSNGNCADINIAAMDIDLSFDDVVSICSDCLHVDILPYVESDRDNFTFSYENRHIIYYGDYASYMDSFNGLLESAGTVYGLNGEIISDGISPRSDEHVVRMLQVDNITICEYEDEEWARLAYSERVSNIDGIETMDSDSSNGFSCIISGPSEDSLNVTYYCYNCVLYYTYEVDSSNDDYSIYQDLCDSIGLPTSDVMTQIVLGDSVG